MIPRGFRSHLPVDEIVGDELNGGLPVAKCVAGGRIVSGSMHELGKRDAWRSPAGSRCEIAGSAFRRTRLRDVALSEDCRVRKYRCVLSSARHCRRLASEQVHGDEVLSK